MDESKPGFNLAKFFFGILVLMLGLFYLAKNAGLINFDLALNPRQLWPIIIIFIGLSMIELRGFWGALAGILLSLLVIALVIFLLFSQVLVADC